MKKIVYLVIALIFIVSMSSCGAAGSIEKNENEVAGYTLKNKKELMQQKILNTQNKTLIACP